MSLFFFIPSFYGQICLNLLYSNQLNILIMSFLYFIIIGGVAGWLAGNIMKGGGFGLVMNIVLGIIGSVVGGWLFSFLGLSSNEGLIGSLITALAGAVLILFIGRLIKK